MTISAIASIIAAGVGILLALMRVVIYRRARADARREFELEAREAEIEAARKRREKEHEVQGLPDDELRQRLSRFVRPDNGR